MSDIHGKGHGSEHDWRHSLTATWEGERGSRFVCVRCGVRFVHLYDLVPDIFEAMQLTGVPARCVGLGDVPS